MLVRPDGIRLGTLLHRPFTLKNQLLHRLRQRVGYSIAAVPDNPVLFKAVPRPPLVVLRERDMVNADMTGTKFTGKAGSRGQRMEKERIHKSRMQADSGCLRQGLRCIVDIGGKEHMFGAK